MDDLIKTFVNAARTVLVELHDYVEEDGILLAPETIVLVAEMEEVNRQNLIEQSLVTGNKELFMQLTAEE